MKNMYCACSLESLYVFVCYYFLGEQIANSASDRGNSVKGRDDDAANLLI
ncbi:hypothetical protein ECDEC9D_3547 [Escherichia coli DEC9D]|nr:hypothetical protein ECDEC9D_3547 [Escherichia coli DEC9D]